ncbi:MAG: relaxase/mobilization nuclease domain-containing protein [Bacteroidaceae bacterium]|nr:relaxase/mobilization nuclease domain-containing protein [Bacteroidaceae bacterium]
MAILKVCNSKASGHAALNGVAQYILDKSKTQERLVSGMGDFAYCNSELSAEVIFSEFMRVKELFNKDCGRQYMHAVQSFMPGEVDSNMAHELGKKLATELWDGFQVVVVTHTDKNHIHNHFLINSVSYESGKKLHWKKSDLARAKSINDSICIQNKLSVPHKKSFGYIDTSLKSTIWDKNLFNLVKLASKGKRESFMLDCAKAVLSASRKARSKDEFIKFMSEQGWTTSWEDSRKFITFVDNNNHKVRNSRLSKIVEKDICKESLEKMFIKNSEKSCRMRQRKDIKYEKIHI